MSPAALKALVGGDVSNFMVAATPGGIERQEKDGQIEQSFAETLPINGTAEYRATWESLGFVFGEAADDIFVKATFPKGWRKQVTDHSMWSKLLDDKARERGMIFYKAAFYDRSSHVHLSPRFSVSCYDDADNGNAVTVKDSMNVIQTFGVWSTGDYDTQRKLEANASDWLKKNFPNWQDVSAYWE